MNKFLEVGGGVLIVCVIVLFLLFLGSLSNNSIKEQLEVERLNKIQKDKYIQLCIDKGGIPKISSWDGRLTDCIVIK